MPKWDFGSKVARDVSRWNKENKKDWWDKMYKDGDMPAPNTDYHTTNWGDARAPSAWAGQAQAQNQMNLRTSLDQSDMRGRAQTQDVYGALAAKGGLTSGAMERMGNMQGRSQALAGQGMYNAANKNAMSIGMKDQMMGYKSDVANNAILNQGIADQNKYQLDRWNMRHEDWKDKMISDEMAALADKNAAASAKPKDPLAGVGTPNSKEKTWREGNWNDREKGVLGSDTWDVRKWG